MDIVLCGLPKSGKTSIINVIFKKMNPQQCLMLESEAKITSHNQKLSENICLQIYDIPGTQKLENEPPHVNMIESCGALILVIDVQAEPYNDAYAEAVNVIKFVQKYNPKCHIFVFIHKADQDRFQTEDNRNRNFIIKKRLFYTETIQKMREQLNDHLEEAKLNQIVIEYYMTTIYDHTLYEAFSRVVQKVIPKVVYVKNLLDSLVGTCKFDKAFLFEMYTKLCIQTDSFPYDINNFAICSEMIDVFIDISCIYGQYQGQNQSENFAESTIKLDNGDVLLLYEVEKFLVLIILIKEENFDRPYLVNYNVDIFRKSLKELFDFK